MLRARLLRGAHSIASVLQYASSDAGFFAKVELRVRLFGYRQSHRSSLRCRNRIASLTMSPRPLLLPRSPAPPRCHCLTTSRARSTHRRAARARVVSASRENDEAELDELVANLEGQKPTIASVRGDWDLLYTSKSEFDPANPLGRRVDGTAPGIEKIFDVAFSQAEAVASSSPIQRFVTGLESVEIRQVVELDGQGVGGSINMLRRAKTSSSASRRAGASTRRRAAWTSRSTTRTSRPLACGSPTPCPSGF